MYIRIKKVKGNEYAYLVENKWRKRGLENGGKGPRQKVKGYLGRVYRLNVVNDVEFSKFIGIDDLDHYINSKCKSEILSDLVRWEIYKHDVAEQGFASSGDGFGVMKDGKSVVLGVNEGFLCSASVERVLKFREKEYEELGVRLAKRFVQAGLNVPKEVFVGWFGKGKG